MTKYVVVRIERYSPIREKDLFLGCFPVVKESYDSVWAINEKEDEEEFSKIMRVRFLTDEDISDEIDSINDLVIEYHNKLNEKKYNMINKIKNKYERKYRYSDGYAEEYQKYYDKYAEELRNNNIQ